ncbi:MAG TPA: TIGR03000 domain-containing protein [Gemmataceae bacterium]|nr:TIGR03000 domain-containing protein [Gemmataceae bacterium]
MRVNGGLWGGSWQAVLGGTVFLLGLAGTGLPECHAQMRYSGGFIQTRREREYVPTESENIKLVPTTPKTPRDYFPDGDFSYASFYAGGGPLNPPSSAAGLLPFGIPAAAFPWNQVGFEDYNEPTQVLRDSSIAEPKKYALEITPLPQAASAARTETAVLIAHLPEQAAFWVEGTRTHSTGRTRYFQSPPLQAGRKYTYRVRAAWIENGRIVSQTRIIPVQAGLIQAIYLRPTLGSLSSAAGR